MPSVARTSLEAEPRGDLQLGPDVLEGLVGGHRAAGPAEQVGVDAQGDRDQAEAVDGVAEGALVVGRDRREPPPGLVADDLEGGAAPASATRCRIDAALSPARQSGVKEKSVVPYWMSVTAPPLVGPDAWVTADTYFC